MNIEIVRNTSSEDLDAVFPYVCPTAEEVYEVMELPFIFTFYRKTIYDLCMAGF